MRALVQGVRHFYDWQRRLLERTLGSFLLGLRPLCGLCRGVVLGAMTQCPEKRRHLVTDEPLPSLAEDELAELCDFDAQLLDRCRQVGDDPLLAGDDLISRVGLRHAQFRSQTRPLVDPCRVRR